mmetsp:Transcript_40528/g.87777  ORF Transcript_40528/g.87777 Transcript_40528/m.87777 type:complete len:229 (+) Transcript_40528:166-852(+)
MFPELLLNLFCLLFALFSLSHRSIAHILRLSEPLPPSALNADHLRNQMKLSTTHQPSSNVSLNAGGFLLLHLVPQPLSQRMAAHNSLDVDGCPTGAQVAAQELLAHQGAPEQGLNPLGCSEAPPRALELSSSDLAADPTNLGPGEPASNVALNRDSCHFSLPNLFILGFPPHTTQVPAPDALDLQRTPELLLRPHRLSPHAQTHQEAPSIALHRDDLLHMPPKLFHQL